jgi:hypothetical protein
MAGGPSQGAINLKLPQGLGDRFADRVGRTENSRIDDAVKSGRPPEAASKGARRLAEAPESNVPSLLRRIVCSDLICTRVFH